MTLTKSKAKTAARVAPTTKKKTASKPSTRRATRPAPPTSLPSSDEKRAVEYYGVENKKQPNVRGPRWVAVSPDPRPETDRKHVEKRTFIAMGSRPDESDLVFHGVGPFIVSEQNARRLERFTGSHEDLDPDVDSPSGRLFLVMPEAAWKAKRGGNRKADSSDLEAAQLAAEKAFNKAASSRMSDAVIARIAAGGVR